MLVVHEPPKDCHQSIQNRHSSVEWQLWDDGRCQLAVGVAELDDGIKLVCSAVDLCKDAVIAGILDRVLDGRRGIEVHGRRLDLVVGFRGNVAGRDELALLVLVAVLVLDGLRGADFEQPLHVSAM